MNAQLEMTTLEEDKHYAKWRSWASDVRDSRPPYHKAPAEAKETARTLCAVLDAWETVRKAARRPHSPKTTDSEMKLTVQRLIDRLKKIGVPLPMSTAPSVLEYLWNALQMVVGQPATLVTDEGLFRRQVVERGWAALPDAMKKKGLAQLCWDELLLTLRREVYKVVNGKLTIRPDAPNRIMAVLAWMLAPPSAPTAMSSETQYSEQCRHRRA
jgi:hypothetical protein